MPGALAYLTDVATGAVIGKGTRITRPIIYMGEYTGGWGWVKNDDKSKIFFKINVFNQYNDCNIGFKAWLMFDINLNLEYHIFI